MGKKSKNKSKIGRGRSGGAAASNNNNNNKTATSVVATDDIEDNHFFTFTPAEAAMHLHAITLPEFEELKAVPMGEDMDRFLMQLIIKARRDSGKVLVDRFVKMRIPRDEQLVGVVALSRLSDEERANITLDELNAMVRAKYIKYLFEGKEEEEEEEAEEGEEEAVDDTFAYFFARLESDLESAKSLRRRMDQMYAASDLLAYIAEKKKLLDQLGEAAMQFIEGKEEKEE